jgi:hypothetical protein
MGGERRSGQVLFAQGALMTRSAVVAFAVVILGLGGGARAEDKPDPNGTWKWTTEVNNRTRDMTLKLKLEKDKLTGTITGGRNNEEREIEDATYKEGEVTFKVTRERNGRKFTTKYNGKVSGDTIKGKAEFERRGQTDSRDWEAKRSKDK